MFTLSLKKFKFFPSLSEETNCFTADLYINGKLVGTTSNRGYGGNTDIHHANSEGLTLISQADKYFKSLPPKRVDCSWDDKGYFEMKSSLENEVDELVDNLIQEKDKKRIEKWVDSHCKKGIVVDSKKGTYHFYPFDMSKPMPILAKVVQQVMAKHPDGAIMNENIATF